MISEVKSLSDITAIFDREQEVFVVYDRNIESKVKAFDWPMLAIDTSEALKTVETVQAICRWLMSEGATRDALVLAIGGGITTDMVGFAASVYKRGIRYANIPTTLLAQVDAAIGGKTGVNLDGYKNMLGAFRMPEYTFICSEVLKTLPTREYLSGMAELLKTFLIADGIAYSESLLGVTQSLILRAAQIKADIVKRDPYERGERAKLNLGHTFGHAIEHVAQQNGNDITHGKAVAMGIILASRLSERLGLAENGLSARLENDFQSVGLSTNCPYTIEQLKEAMAKDKKAKGGGVVKFVLPIKPGDVAFYDINPYKI